MVGRPGQEETVTVLRQLQALAAVTAVQGVVWAASANEQDVKEDLCWTKNCIYAVPRIVFVSVPRIPFVSVP